MTRRRPSPYWIGSCRRWRPSTRSWWATCGHWRGKALGYLGDLDGAVADCATATALERTAAPTGWGGALLDEAEVLARAGRTDEAFARLDEFAALQAQHPERPPCTPATSTTCAATWLGQPAATPRPCRCTCCRCANPLPHGNTLQVCFDLGGLTETLIDNADFGAGLEAAGMTRAASIELFGAATFADRIVGADCLERAESAVGAERAGQLKAAGMAVPAGQRLVRAGELQAAAQARTRRLADPP